MWAWGGGILLLDQWVDLIYCVVKWLIDDHERVNTAPIPKLGIVFLWS